MDNFRYTKITNKNAYDEHRKRFSLPFLRYKNKKRCEISFSQRIRMFFS